MTDVAAASPQLAARSAEQAKLVAKRYATERRFRAYGMTAIIITALFVFFLVFDILSKGLPAFTEHRIDLKLMADAAAIDPSNSRDPQKILAGDFDKLIREALRSRFPDVESRGDRKLLTGLLSSGAADDFRSMVAGDPSLIGTEITVPVVLSDDADQYFKGGQTDVTRDNGAAELTIAADAGTATLSAAEPVFRASLAAVKAFVFTRHAIESKELTRLDAALARLDGDIAEAAKRAAAAEQSGDATGAALAKAHSDKLAADKTSLSTVRDTLKAKVDDYAARIAASKGAETLGGNLPSLLVSAAGGMFRITELGETSAKAEIAIKPAAAAAPAGQWTTMLLETPENDRRVSDKEAVWLESLEAQGLAKSGFAWRFLTSGDSREPELAGIRGALTGSILTLIVTLGICLPIGVGAAVYLEEFAPKNRVTDLIEVNINNLAAVPSIVFGLLGLAMFLNFFGLPRSAPLVGGLVLALLVLPTIIIASRAALKAVPPSIKEAALGVGASHQQAIFHHVLPLAVPGIMTGTIIGMAHALGETAPLLMIGMVAFIVDIPGSFVSAATALPVQVYLWSDLPEIAFQAKTAAAIIILLFVLFGMNALAIIVRKKFERRW